MASPATSTSTLSDADPEHDHHDSATYNPVVRINALYRSFLLSNSQRIHQVESSVRNLTWFLPSQGLSVESVYTFLNLLSLYHDSLLASSPEMIAVNASSSATSTLALPTSPHTRYTKFWLKQSRLYKGVARALSVIAYAQLLLEMAGKKYKGERGRWRVVIGLETVKALLRLVLLRLTAQRTVLQPSIPEREVDPSTLAQAEARAKSPAAAVPETWKAARSGFELPTIASLRSQAGGGALRVENEITAFLQKKVLTIDGVCKPYDLVRKRHGLGVIAEIVWILRPLIYVLALKRYGKKHLYPFLLSLALEYFAYQNMADTLRASSTRGGTEVEKQELAKRRKAFWAYCFRGPLWYGWTRERVEGFTAKFQGVFGIGLIANIVDEYKHLIDDYHYYSSS